MIDTLLPELCKDLPGRVPDLIDGQQDLLVLLDCQGREGGRRCTLVGEVTSYYEVVGRQ